MKTKLHLFPMPLAAALVAALTACGGGGGADSARGEATSFDGTAYLKTRHTELYEGKTYGLMRELTQGLVDECNFIRSGFYGLPAVVPPDELMASTDVRIIEKYFDTDKALTIITSHGVEFPDLNRWQDEVNSGAVSTAPIPPLPPDCSVAHSQESKSGTLWRDGITYELNFDTKRANGHKTFNRQVPLTSTETEYLAFPSNNYLGQTCHEVTSASSVFTSVGKTCVWDRFPFVGYLNWPYGLSGQIRYGAENIRVETIEPLDVQRDQGIAPAVFEVPAGFSTTVVN